MTARTILICAKDKTYARRLAEYIAGRRDYAFRVHFCDTIETAVKLTASVAVDYLLIDSAFSDEEIKSIPAGKCFVLTDHPREKSDLGPAIFKYCSGEGVLSSLAARCVDDLMLTVDTKGEASVKIVGFYSPVKRVGQTALALALARRLAREDGTLYLNLCPFGAEGYFPQGEASSLEDMIYFLLQEAPNPGIRLKNMTGHLGGVDYLLPFQSSEDLLDVEPCEWENLLEMIRREGGYGVVILDLGDGLRGRREILRHCTHIFMPVLDDEYSDKKTARFAAEYAQRETETPDGEEYGEDRQVIERIRKVPMEKDIGETAAVLARTVLGERSGLEPV